MEKLDLKDKKILFELDQNSRQSFRSIGRKVGLSKDVVASRVSKLQERGIIKRFYPYFDQIQFGRTMCRFYFKYHYITPKIKKEIIDHFCCNENVQNVFSTEGSYDFGVIMNVKNIKDMYPFWKKTIDTYGDYFSKKVFSVYVGEGIYGQRYLIDKDELKSKSPYLRGLGKVDVDDFDLKIIELLSKDARIPTIDIANKLNSTVTTINSRIKKLLENKVILGFTVDIDNSKIGYHIWKVDLFLSEPNKSYAIIKFLEDNPCLYSVDYTIGYADLELELFVKDLSQLNKIIEELYLNFPRIIREYTFFRVVEMHKWYEFE